MKDPSLWLAPRRRPIVVKLSRFRSYPHFFDALEEHLGHVPKEALIHWLPFADFTKYAIETNSEEEDEELEFFLDDVARMIRRGEDVPPLVRSRDDRPVDGTHRAFAASRLRIRRAPTMFV